MDKDAFQLNIEGVENLIGSNTNKVLYDGTEQEGASSQALDDLDLEMDDTELLSLSRQWENKYAPYQGKLSPRQQQNKKYLFGSQNTGNSGKTTASNMLFEATATFVPQALAKNPEPVVWSDNTEEGKQASNDIKTALQFHGDILNLRKKLGVMVWQWGIYFIAGVKHGWDNDINDIVTDIRKPQNLIFDPDGYVDEFGDFKSWLGERIQCTATELIAKFPDSESYITIQVDGKLGTQVTYTEWWTDEYCFYTFKDVVLDKHKNQFFNYGKTPDKTNHFAKPKKPYTFLSVFSLQEQPHDFTNLIEQNVSNQDDVIESDKQVGKNLRHGNNSIVCDDKFFTSETAHQAADALERGDPILGDPNGIKRIPANPLPNGLLEAMQIKKETLRSIYGTQGISAQPQNQDTTARGMLLNQSHDSTRIGGGIGDALEQVADNIFNWWLQMYYVFYDEPHYAAIMGQAHAIEFTKILLVGEQRHFVVSVSPNSMQPKDEITEMNQAIDLANKGWLDPINLFKKLNYADPMETAKMVTMFRVSPESYMQQYFPQEAQQAQINQSQQGNPPDMGPVSGEPVQPLSAEPANADLSQIPLQ
jgi:hypothetical protein